VLTDTKVKNLKPKETQYRVSDSNGLYIEVRNTGSKYWRQNYRYNNKQKTLSHGVYPRVSLAKARKLRDEALEQLTDGLDPAKQKRLLKATRLNTFGSIALEWFEKQQENWKPAYAQKLWHQLEKDVLPYLENEPITQVTVTDLFNILKRVEQRNALDLAMRLRQRCDAIFKHAILTERATNNPAAHLVGALKTRKTTHQKALDQKELPEFIRKLTHYDGHIISKLATQMLMYTFVRTSELRFAKWGEFDLDKRLWEIPGERMKMGNDHIVPLADQALHILEQLKPINGHREFVFASPQKPKQPISENAILNVIYRLGYKGKATGHGFRATASTILNEMGYNSDAIERQLAHAERNKVRAAYHRSEYLEQRIELMRGWADYLCSLSTPIIPIKSGVHKNG